MNLAIVLAVSDYGSVENNLPGSKKDGEIIEGLLKVTNKYDKTLVINQNEPSSEVKKLLTNFIAENKDFEVEELFFYYSGHGEFISDEFYYLLSDYNNKRKHQTSLQNSEVDDLIRTLSPKLLIKVIDACQSGTNYIKANDVIVKYFNDTKQGFNKCYFLNSSLSDQSSYQDENLSFFTKSFIDSLKEHSLTEIRFKDIIDFILDDFEGVNEQTPFFVIQADFTEKFCVLNDSIKKFLKTYSVSNNLDDKKNDNKKVQSIVDIVKSNAKEYVDKEGAIEAMNYCIKEFKKKNIADDIKELYTLNLEFIHDNNSLPASGSIGRWLLDNNHDFFAKPYYVEHYSEFDNEFFKTIDGYEFLIEDAPFNAISIDIIGLYPNIKSYKCNVVLLISKNKITFFYSILQYIDDGWNSRILDKNGIKWKYVNCKIGSKESITKGINHIYSSITENIKSILYKELGLNTDEEEDDLPF
ncbi:caspase family protein [Mesoflavibacter profundi]|uniref:Caspase family protein n=1 Tax=Mesoflavibacter profundi TaxID=2708110 RepID=A0ABT4RY16_9FLAO|nr:caspase family protein [Mesoflavibacter profundi]MDA0176715.1 caspase family protein [Mesoflavibacter profundi]